MISQGIPICATTISNPIFRKFYRTREHVLSYLRWSYDKKGIEKYQTYLSEREKPNW